MKYMKVGRWKFPELRVLEYLRIIDQTEKYGSNYYFESRRRLLHDKFLEISGIERTDYKKRKELDKEFSILYYEMYQNNNFVDLKTIKKPSDFEEA